MAMEQRIFALYILDRQECEAIVQMNAKEMNIFGDVNLFWDFPFNDLYQQCRDDILHQMDLGIMQHVENAAFSRYITDLRKATNSDA